MTDTAQPRDVVRTLSQLTSVLTGRAALSGKVEDEALRDYAALITISAVYIALPDREAPDHSAVERLLVDAIGPRLAEIEKPWISGPGETDTSARLVMLERVYQEICHTACTLPHSLHRRLLVWRDDLREGVLRFAPDEVDEDDVPTDTRPISITACPVCGFDPAVGHAESCPRNV